MTAATDAGHNVYSWCQVWIMKTCEEAGVHKDTSLIGREIGRSRSSAPWRSAKCRHLEIGSLPADVLAGVLDLALVWLP